jgi:hypothetical protein
VSVLVAGAGLDGELPEDYVRERCANLGAVHALRIEPAHTRSVRHVLDWHPSEATALLVGAALGLRGNVEIRDRGLPVRLTDHSCDVWELQHHALFEASTIAQELSSATTLAAAEATVFRVTGKSEIEYERTKSAVRRDPDYDIGLRDLASRLESFDREARSRGVDYVTHRRLAEALNLAGGTEVRLETIGGRIDTSEAWPLRRIPETP